MLLDVTIAYIGPGPGLGLTWALIGLLITLLSAAGAVLFWPVRALIARLRRRSESRSNESGAEAESAEAAGGTADRPPRDGTDEASMRRSSGGRPLD